MVGDAVDHRGGDGLVVVTANDRFRRRRAAHEIEVQRLQRRVRALEETSDALGEAVGLVHARNEQEPDAIPPTTEPSGSSTPSTASSPS